MSDDVFNRNALFLLLDQHFSQLSGDLAGHIDLDKNKPT